ncbi:CotD family spore coat protein [Neobacillus niacini]|uniref:CotD family spore coat protein n=1 Tax=Neobacillus niacini TaxID=86668 RepID=UPI0009EE814A|nr:CotD family spore coat protein [Neobacillus niacini]
MYLGTNFAPPVIHPTQQFVNHTFSTTVVPHIHPKHITTINHHMFQHKHYCPTTASCCEVCSNQHIDCCCPGGPTPMPAPIAAPMAAPTAVAGAQSNALPNMPPNMGPGMMGPGMGPGMMGPGMGPGMMGPGMGPGMMGPGMAPGMGPGMAPGQLPRPKRLWG